MQIIFYCRNDRANYEILSTNLHTFLSKDFLRKLVCRYFYGSSLLIYTL